MPFARIALLVVAAALLLAACGSGDDTEAQVRDAIDDYVAAVNAGGLADSGLSNCSTPFYQEVALANPGLRPFRYEVARVISEPGSYRASGGVMEIHVERDGLAAVVRGVASLGDRPVRELADPHPLEDGWIWVREAGTWRAIECG